METTDRPETDLVILLDEFGQAVGTAPRARVHDANTPLHLAFSCYVIREGGEVLMTRRALSKTAWPGVWTNSCCGHPLPGEDPASAVRRRVHDELGLALGDLKMVLPDFRYRATDSRGIVENEVCPVYVARALGSPAPEPAEVDTFVWAEPARVASAIRDAPWAFSPWAVAQCAELDLERIGELLAPSPAGQE